MEEETVSDFGRYVLNAVASGQNVFLTGPGGVGKTTLLKTLFKHLDRAKKKYAQTALTGVAACLIGGTTIHKLLGLKRGANDVESMLKAVQKDTANVLRELQVLIIDEISMCSIKKFERWDEYLRRIRREDAPFGGLQLVVSGDVMQLPPVPSKPDTGEDDDYDPLCCVFSSTWADMNFLHAELDVPKRFTDRRYQDFLSRARMGLQTRADLDMLRGRVMTNEYLEELTKQQSILRLYPKNKQVEEENNRFLRRYPGARIFMYRSEDYYCDHYARETFDLESAIPRDLSLFTGAQVMLRKNLPNGCYNGLVGTVFECREGEVTVDFPVFGRVAVPQVKWEFGVGSIVMAHRKQIPLVLAFASNFHRVQGMTCQKLIVDLGPDVFGESQAYVALSRVRSLDGLYLMNMHPRSFRTNKNGKMFYEAKIGDWVIESKYLAGVANGSIRPPPQILFQVANDELELSEDDDSDSSDSLNESSDGSEMSDETMTTATNNENGDDSFESDDSE